MWSEKQNVVVSAGCVGAGAWGGLLGVCVSVSFCWRNPTLSRQGAMGEADKGDHSKSEPQHSTVWQVPYRARPRNFICIFPPDFYNHRKQLPCYHRCLISTDEAAPAQ